MMYSKPTSIPKDPIGFTQRALKIRQILKEGNNNPLLISHHDADGISALAVMSDYLDSINQNYEYKIVKGLDSTIIEDINSLGHSLVIFLDLGNDPILTNLVHRTSRDVIIIDHHSPARCCYPVRRILLPSW